MSGETFNTVGEIYHDDASYSGETGESAFELQYYRNKAAEFQAVMNGLDKVEFALRGAMEALFTDDPTGEKHATEIGDIQIMLEELDEKRGPVVMAAQAINAASSSLNAAGVRFPVVSYAQQTLGLAPLAIAAIAAGAVAGAAALIIWGKDFIQRAFNLLNNIAALDSITDPIAKADLAYRITVAGTADKETNSPLTQIAGIVKWGAILIIGAMTVKAFADYSKKG